MTDPPVRDLSPQFQRIRLLENLLTDLLNFAYTVPQGKPGCQLQRLLDECEMVLADRISPVTMPVALGPPDCCDRLGEDF